jgi:ketosteroid isomerase-like protein
MEPGARTPEELETLFEDAFVTRDADAVSAMFADGAVLVCGPGGRQAHGPDQIARLVAALWDGDATYVAEPRHVVQARDAALVLGTGGVSVACRGSDRGWRYAIALLSVDDQHPEGGRP